MRNYRVRSEETPSVKRVTYSVKDFQGIDAKSEENTLSMRVAREAANVGISCGSITSGPGFSDPELYEGRVVPQPYKQGLHFTSCFLYPIKDLATGVRHDRLLARNELNGFFYRVELDEGAEWVRSGGLSLPEDVCGLPLTRAGEDMFIVCRPEGNFFMFLYDDYSWQSAPHFTSICCQKGRAFAVNPETNRLYYSRLGSFTGWTPEPGVPGAAGYFEIEEDGGRAMEVVAFNGMVYLIKENAVMQLKVFTDVTEFQLSKVFETSGRIYPKTVAVGESAIYFLTDDGLYAFDGYNAVRIFEGLTVNIGDKSASHAVFSGWKYYLATNVKGDGIYGDEADGLTNNAVIVFDIALGTASVARGVDVLWFTPVAKGKSSAVLCGFRNEKRKGHIAKIDGSGELFGVPFRKYWATSESNLEEPARYKVLRRAYISSAHNAEVEFIFDGKGYKYPLNGSPNAQQININRPCRTLKTVFRSDSSEFKIRDFTLDVDLIRRYYGEGE